MALHFYRETPLGPGTQISPLDIFTATGSSATFTLINKSGAELGSTITAGNTQYDQYNGGFTKSGNSFTLSSTPVAGTVVVAPGVTQLVTAAFDNDDVDGVTNPREDEVEFWMGDPTEIHLYQYEPYPNIYGIKISLEDEIVSSGASLTWVQLACSDPVTGLALTYLATGESLYTPALSSFGTISASTPAASGIIYTDQAESFYAGDYIMVNIGQPTQEILHITSITTVAPKRLNVDVGDFPHYIGETIYTCARKFWMKLTVPDGQTSNTAVNYYDIGLRRKGKIRRRT